MSILSEFFAATPFVAAGVLGAIIFFGLIGFFFGASSFDGFDPQEGLEWAAQAAVTVLVIAVAGWVSVLIVTTILSFAGVTSA